MFLTSLQTVFFNNLLKDPGGPLTYLDKVTRLMREAGCSEPCRTGMELSVTIDSGGLNSETTNGTCSMGGLK